MKKIIVNLIAFLMLISLCGCCNSSSSDENSKKNQVYTETQGDLLITYVYDYNDVVSKNVYDKNTGITTDYTYFYNNNGWGKWLVDVSIVTITRDGKIIDQFESD